MKARELREKTDAELEQTLGDLKREIFDIGIKASTGQVENAGRARQVRRDLARILTVLHERKRTSNGR